MVQWGTLLSQEGEQSWSKQEVLLRGCLGEVNTNFLRNWKSGCMWVKYPKGYILTTNFKILNACASQIKDICGPAVVHKDCQL